MREFTVTPVQSTAVMTSPFRSGLLVNWPCNGLIFYQFMMFFNIMLHYTILHLRCLLLRCWLNSRTWQWSGAGMTQGGRAQSISWGFGTRKSKIRWMELILHRLIGGKHPSIYRVSTIRLVMRDFAGPSTVCQKHGLIQLASLIILVG